MANTRPFGAVTSVRATVAVALVALAAIPMSAAQGAKPVQLRDPWTAAEIVVLASMQLKDAVAPPTEPSNAYEQRAGAAEFGRALFNDPRLSKNGQVACVTCHSDKAQFEDGLQVGQGIGKGKRRTMPVMGAAHAPFLFWDGRKDSLWSQALGPLEDAAEHGGNRVSFARLIRVSYRDQYQKVFGDIPELANLPQDATPNGTETERAAWAAMSEGGRDAVNRMFANLGKAIAAYERKVSYGESRFDQYVKATVAGDGRAQEVFTQPEARGLRLFLTKGQCVTCHNGPQLTDHAFHNTGVPSREPANPDRGRADGVTKLLGDPFNCLGRYSDARPEQCGELQYLSTNDPRHLGAFRTPSLRHVAARPPYMHAGQFSTLTQVVQHYATSPQAPIGHSELARLNDKHADRQVIRLSTTDVQDLAAFLATLTGPVVQPR